MLAGRAPGLVPAYRAAVTEPAPRAFGAAMTAGETALAAAILTRDPAARLGLLGVAAFRWASRRWASSRGATRFWLSAPCTWPAAHGRPRPSTAVARDDRMCRFISHVSVPRRR